MSKVFSLINPPPGFTISNDGEIAVDPLAPPFSGLLNVACSTGTANASATIEFNWLIPVKSPLYRESGELVATSGSTAVISEYVQVLDGLLSAISGSIAEMEEIGVGLLTARSGSIASIGSPDLIASGIVWDYFLWDADFGSVISDAVLAKNIEVFTPLGFVGSATDFASVVCIPSIAAELLTQVRSHFGDPSWTYFDCLDGQPGQGALQANQPTCAIYYFQRP